MCGSTTRRCPPYENVRSRFSRIARSTSYFSIFPSFRMAPTTLRCPAFGSAYRRRSRMPSSFAAAMAGFENPEADTSSRRPLANSRRTVPESTGLDQCFTSTVRPQSGLPEPPRCLRFRRRQAARSARSHAGREVREDVRTLRSIERAAAIPTAAKPRRTIILKG